MAEWLGHADEARRWRAEADQVAAQVIAEGYCPRREAYLQTYDKNSPLDISALALVLWDLLPADDERIVKTVAAFERPLKLPETATRGDPDRHNGSDDQPTTDDPYWGQHHLKGGLRMNGAFARYDYAAEPFYLPTLWMARYYLRAGRPRPGRAAGPRLSRQRDQSRTDGGALQSRHRAPVGQFSSSFQPRGISFDHPGIGGHP